MNWWALAPSVAGAPLLVLLYEASLQPRAFPYVLHATEFVGFLAAIGLCWVWPLSRLVAIFNPERGALTELALLPGFGSGRQQLRRLYLVALGLPFAGLILLLISALVLVTLQHLRNGVYLQLTLEFLFIPLITLPILIGQHYQAEHARRLVRESPVAFPDVHDFLPGMVEHLGFRRRLLQPRYTSCACWRLGWSLLR